MKINTAALDSSFLRPSATFDRPSQSFADFLGDAAAQRGQSASQASSFGAKGFFGASAVSAGLSPGGAFGSGIALDTPSAVAPVPMPELFDESSADLAMQGDADEGLPSANSSAASGFMISPDAAVEVGQSEANLPPKSVGQPGGANVQEDLEAEIGPETPGDSQTLEEQEQLVLICGDGDVLDVHMASSALGEIDNDRLRRRVAKAVADHGWRLADLRLNSELLTTTGNGEIDGVRD